MQPFPDWRYFSMGTVMQLVLWILGIGLPILTIIGLWWVLTLPSRYCPICGGISWKTDYRKMGQSHVLKVRICENCRHREDC